MTAKAASSPITALLLLVCGGFLAGCGESLTSLPSSDLGGKPVAAAGQLGIAEGSAKTVRPPAGSAGGATVLSMAAGPATTVAAAPVGSAVGSIDAKTATDAFIAVSTPGNTAYKIGPEDVVDVSVFKVPELSRSVQVADGGTINLPLVGEIAAAGKTAREVEQDLTQKLGAKYLKSPQVTVFVKEYNSQRVTLEGAVKKPGVYPIRGKSSLLQMIASAGGLEEVADGSAVLVVRQTGGKRYAGKFDIDALRSGAAEDPAVQAGDVVIVQNSLAKQTLQNFLKILPVANTLALL